ncbi:MAG: MFS transporter [Thermoanaerobaculaceae bacterium]
MPRRLLAILFIIVFLDLVGFGIVIPLLPLYAERYQPSPWVFGLLLSSFSLMQFFFAPVLGRLSDRWGRRPVLVLSLTGSAVGYLLFALADSLALLFASRIIAGVAGANIATAQAVIADVTSPEERTRGMGLIGAAFGLGFVAGPAIAGLLLPFSARLPGFAAAAFSAFAWAAAFFALPETRQAGQARGSRWQTVGSRRLGLLLVVGFLVVTGWAGFEVTFAQFLHARLLLAPSQVAWLFAYVGVLVVLVQGFFVRRLPSFWTPKTLLIPGLVFSVVALVIVAGTSTVAQLLMVLPLLALGQGLVNPALSAWISRQASAEFQGQALGAFQATNSLARIVGPFVGEMAFGHLGATAPPMLAAALAAVAALLVLLP